MLTVNNVNPNCCNRNNNAFGSFHKQYFDAIKPQKVNQKPISCKEGSKIILKGLWDKTKNIVKSIISHPFKTLAAIGLTTAGLMALPLLGISMATGGAALVVGFGTIAIFDTAKNIYKTRKNIKAGKFDLAREHLHNIGGNIVDLALTLPFMPKALKQLKRNVPLYFNRDIRIGKIDEKVVMIKKKYYGGDAYYWFDESGKVCKISGKNSLLSQILKTKSWKERFNLLTRQDRTELMYEKINQAYKQVANDRGYKYAKDIKFESKPEIGQLRLGDDKQLYFYSTKKDGGMVTFDNLDTAHLNTQSTVNEFIENIGHEHRHTEQNSMILRAEGLADKDFQMTDGSLGLANCKNGPIKKGTPEYIQAQKFYEAHKNYPKEITKENFQEYSNNLLEVDAREVGETEIAQQIREKLHKNTGVSVDKNTAWDSVKYNPAKDIAVSDVLIAKHSAE